MDLASNKASPMLVVDVILPIQKESIKAITVRTNPNMCESRPNNAGEVSTSAAGKDIGSSLLIIIAASPKGRLAVHRNNISDEDTPWNTLVPTELRR